MNIIPFPQAERHLLAAVFPEQPRDVGIVGAAENTAVFPGLRDKTSVALQRAGEILVIIKMFAVYIGDNRVFRPVVKERPVGFVRLGNEKPAVPVAGVGVDVTQYPSYRNHGRQPRLQQKIGSQGSGGGFTMAACHGYDLLAGHELRERLRPFQNPEPQPARFGHLRIVFTDRGTVNNGVRSAQVGRGMA